MAGLADSIVVTPSIEPGVYPSAVGVSFDIPTAGVDAVTYGLDTRPSIGKNLAKDQYGYPYIAVVEDGLGRVYFDGGFPKFYSNYFTSSWTRFDQLSDAFKMLHNVLNWVHNPSKAKKLLVICDTVASTYYGFGSGPNNFTTSIPKTAQIAGFTTDIISYGTSNIDVPTATLEKYSVVLLMASQSTTHSRLTDNTVNNLVLFRENNNGLVVITDHNVFQSSANHLANKFGVTFSGNIDRTSSHAAYKIANIIATYGNHPIWNGLTSAIPAGGSEGLITLTEAPAYTGQTLNIAAGYHTINILVRATDGSISLRTFPYAVGVPDPVTWNTTTTRTIKSTFDVNGFRVEQLNGSPTSGFVKYKGRVLGAFQNDGSRFLTSYYSGSMVNLEIGSNTIDIEIREPLLFMHHRTIVRDPLVKTVSCARTAIWFCKDEAANGVNFQRLPSKLDNVKAVIGVPRSHKLTTYIDNIANYGRATGLIKKPKKIVVLGDSIAQSWPINCAEAPSALPNDPEDKRAWSAKAALATGHIVKNKGIGGNRTDQMIARFDVDVTPVKPDYVILVAGANNAIQGEDLAYLDPKIQELVDKIISIGAIPILANYMNINDSVANAIHPGVSDFLIAINTLITAIAARNGVMCINWYGCLNPVTDFTPDGLHPNASGYDKMAKVVAPILGTL